MLITLAARRAQLRRRRRRDALREWAGVAAAATFGVWLVAVVLATLVAR